MTEREFQALEQAACEAQFVAVAVAAAAEYGVDVERELATQSTLSALDTRANNQPG